MSSFKTDRLLGVWSARGVFGLGIAYLVTLLVAFASAGTFSAPLADPYLAVLECEILLMAPLLVVLFAAIHLGPGRGRVATLAALGFIALCAGTTSIVHVVLLTAGHQQWLAPSDHLPLARPWDWPSIPYAVDIVAWDLFLGLALLFGATAFSGGKLERTVRTGMLLAGALCVAGLIGPFVGDLRFRWVGIFGYAVIFPAVCFLLARFFTKAEW